MTGPLWFANLWAWWAQAAVLVAAGSLLPRALGVRQPRLLLGYWRALLGACLALPVAEPWQRSATAAAGVTVSLGPAGVLGAARTRVPAYEVVAAVIAAGVLLRLLQVAAGLVRLRAYRRTARPLGPLSSALDAVAARVGARAEFRLSPSLPSPVTFGWLRSVILLPERFLAMPPARQRAIVCHELLHVRRRDWLHQVAEEFLRALLWFHPAILWLVARLRLAREQVVDLEVLGLLGARKPYLEALFEFASGRARVGAIAAPPFLAKRQLSERVSLMLKEVSMSKSRLIATFAAMLGALVLSATLAVWTFPLKAAPQQQPAAAGQTVTACQGSAAGCPTAGIATGVVSGIADRVIAGVRGGVIAGVPGSGGSGVSARAGKGIAAGVGDGIASGVMSGVPGSVGSGVAAGVGGAIPGVVIAGVPGSVGSGVGGGIRGGVIAGVPGGVVAGVPGGVVAGVPGALRAQAGSSEDSWKPEPIHRVLPAYPPAAKAAKVEGDVVLNVEIDGDGRVTNVVVKSGPAMLTQAAMDAVRQWEYAKPATAPMNFDVTLHFELARDAARAPAASEAAKTIVPVSSLKAVRKVPPVYPVEAKNKHVQGAVVLRITVEKDGSVSNAEVVSGPPELVESALHAVRQWQFAPPERAPVVTTVEVNYTLAQ